MEMEMAHVGPPILDALNLELARTGMASTVFIGLAGESARDPTLFVKAIGDFDGVSGC